MATNQQILTEFAVNPPFPGNGEESTLKRAPDGRFLPGIVNTPPRFKTFTDAARAKLANGGAERLVDRLYQDALEARNASDRARCAQELIDRAEGKAVQAVQVIGTLDAGSARLLAELAARFLPPTLEATSSETPVIEPVESENPPK